MHLHLIQSREFFGPPERHSDLHACWHLNDKVFTDQTHPKGRPTFAELFELCKPDAVNVIANADIYFTELEHQPPPGEVWALSRWDITDGIPVLWDHLDSQDAWIVTGRTPPIDAPYPMGVPGCDNALIYALRMAGLTVRNPSKTIRAYHLHLSQYRSYLEGGEGKGRGGVKAYRITPPYGFAKPEHL